MNVIYDTDNLQVYVIAVHGQTFQMTTLKLCPDLLRQKQLTIETNENKEDWSQKYIYND